MPLYTIFLSYAAFIGFGIYIAAMYMTVIYIGIMYITVIYIADMYITVIYCRYVRLT